jgi:hypothetical protein
VAKPRSGFGNHSASRRWEREPRFEAVRRIPCYHFGQFPALFDIRRRPPNRDWADALAAVFFVLNRIRSGWTACRNVRCIEGSSECVSSRFASSCRSVCGAGPPSRERRTSIAAPTSLAIFA